jgi:alkylation response protein AidB-like acyl-CoA dehydrogenase
MLQSTAILRHDHILPLRRLDFLSNIRGVTREAAIRAIGLDEDESFPAEDIRALAAVGALTAPFPRAYGGLGLGTSAEGCLSLVQVLRWIGHASLPLGRLFEGHVNAIGLIARFGTAAQLRQAAHDVSDGLLFGVWNTEGRNGLTLERSASGWRLIGQKAFASGARFIERPIVTVKTAGGGLLMVLARLEAGPDEDRADLSHWLAHGMRASGTGSYDFTNLIIEPDDVIGRDGDYHAQPTFSGGAWRFAAVQMGGIERLLDEARAHLRSAHRDDDPHQLSRLGQAAIAAETAHLWVARAAQMTEGDEGRDPNQVIAYANLARSAVERAGLDVLELVHRSVGLAGFLRTHPIERLSRDLATYLRQPAPDRALTQAAGHILRSETPAADLWS